MNFPIRYLLLLLLLALSLPACQSIAEREDARKLELTLDSYATAVRWQPLDRQYGFLLPELQPDMPPEGLDLLRVTGYEIVSPPRMLAKDKVVQTVTIEYVLTESQVVRSLTDHQVWKLVDKKWQRANPVPEFK
jgi:hypothetical protein